MFSLIPRCLHPNVGLFFCQQQNRRGLFVDRLYEIIGIRGQECWFPRGTEPVTLETLADRAGMSRRSFARHYRQRTGRTPGEAVEIIRLERAQGLLETGTSVASAARKCGFGSPETMRRVFLRRLGIGPKDWQERFRR